jgi:hypothetical protein|nr:hypothetical protein [Kofleriaceae bacterium]
MPATTWSETPDADEDTRFEGYAQWIVELQKRNQHAGSAGRALHHKGHGVYEARFEVLEGLPAEARHGLFATPRSYEALVRYSNGASKRQSDTAGDVRGIAVKVLGVAGDKVLGSAPTQDFLGILSSAGPFASADEFMKVVWAARSPLLAPFRVLGALGPRGFGVVAKLVKGLKAAGTGSLAAKPFFSAVPIQCGPYAVRFRFAPAAGDAALPAGADAYGDDLVGRLARGPIRYDLALQFFESEDRTPIEDPSVDWDAPYVPVARLEVVQQDAASARGRVLSDRGEGLSFDPWHALVAHKPLGGIMRMRKHAYYASARGRTVTPEPATIAALVA